MSKEYIAIIQLRDALALYYGGSFVSAITLAAAAEEILGKLSDEKLRHQLGQPHNEKIKNNYADESAFLLANFIPYPEIQGMTEEEQTLFKEELQRQEISNRNKVRNQLKHKGLGEESVYFDNFKKIAERHISGAIINLKNYKGNLPASEKLIMRYCKERGIS
jgi:hypothetical protein